MSSGHLKDIQGNMLCMGLGGRRKELAHPGSHTQLPLLPGFPRPTLTGPLLFQTRELVSLLGATSDLRSYCLFHQEPGLGSARAVPPF